MKTNANHPSQPTENGLIYGPDCKILNEEYIGLTKREHFSAMAMQGILSNPNGGLLKNGNYTNDPEDISVLATTHADELIKALNKEK